MQPWVIREADYVSFLAHRFDFDAEAVWKDEANADLRTLRDDPNILAAGDVLYIPDQTNAEPKARPLAMGQANDFVSDPPLVDVAVKFFGGDAGTYASKAYTIDELEHLTGLTTDGDGVVTFKAPVSVQMLTVSFTDSGEKRQLLVGGMDPIDTPSGILKRLRNLGYIASSVEDAFDNLDLLRAALVALKEALQPDPDDSPPPSAAPSSGPQILYSGPVTAPEIDIDKDMMTASADGNGDSSAPDPNAAPASSPSVAPAPASSSAPSSAAADPDQSASDDPPPATPSDPTTVYDAGLSDEGKLSDEMESLLLRAYGY